MHVDVKQKFPTLVCNKWIQRCFFFSDSGKQKKVKVGYRFLISSQKNTSELKSAPKNNIWTLQAGLFWKLRGH